MSVVIFRKAVACSHERKRVVKPATRARSQPHSTPSTAVLISVSHAPVDGEFLVGANGSAGTEAHGGCRARPTAT